MHGGDERKTTPQTVIPPCIAIDFSQTKLEPGTIGNLLLPEYSDSKVETITGGLNQMTLNPGGTTSDSLLSEYSDSEEEEQVQQEIKNSNGTGTSFLTPPRFGCVYNLTKTEDIRSDNMGKLVDNIVSIPCKAAPSKLHDNAKAIWEVGGKNTHLAVLCAALQDINGRIKKFVFTSEGWVRDEIKEKAHQLGYHVVETQQSHAEGGLLQFLQERPNTYKRIVSLGCNLDTCANCIKLLELCLGKDFKRLYSDRQKHVSQYKSRNWYTPPAFEQVLLRRGITPSANPCEVHTLRIKRTDEKWQYVRQTTRYVDYSPLENDVWRKRKGRGRFWVNKLVTQDKTLAEIQQRIRMSPTRIAEIIAGDKDSLKHLSSDREALLTVNTDADIESFFSERADRLSTFLGRQKTSALAELIARLKIGSAQFDAYCKKEQLDKRARKTLQKEVLKHLVRHFRIEEKYHWVSERFAGKPNRKFLWRYAKIYEDGNHECESVLSSLVNAKELNYRVKEVVEAIEQVRDEIKRSTTSS